MTTGTELPETDPPRERHPVVEKLAERRERHLERSLIVRGLVVLAGATVLLAGLAMLVLPGPALAVIPIGLALLALEFTWAENLLEKAVVQADKAAAAAKETSRTQRILVAVACVLGGAAFVAWAIVGDVPLLPV